MRVLFIFDDHPHAFAATRATGYMEKYGVELVPLYCKRGETMNAALLAKMDCDLVVIHQTLMSEWMLDCDRPIAILERIDGCQLAGSREWIEQDEVVAVLKAYSMNPQTLQNEHKGRLHFRRMMESGIGPVDSSHEPIDMEKPELLSEKTLAKIHCVWGFPAYQRFDSLRALPVDLSWPRLLDVSFAGTTQYKGTAAGGILDTHRALALDALEKWGLEYPGTSFGYMGRPLPKQAYRVTMQMSRVVLSPYGLGEPAHRDYEAWMLGSVVMRPPSDYIMAWPDIYHPGETYVECKIDFSDAVEKIGEVVDNWGDYLPMRKYARELALQGGHPAEVARQFTDTLKAIL